MVIVHLCLYAPIYMYVYIICVPVHMYINVYMIPMYICHLYVHLCTYTYEPMYICTYTYEPMYICTYIYAPMYIFMYLYNVYCLLCLHIHLFVWFCDCQYKFYIV